MRVAVLTNFIPPYRVPLFEELERKRGTELRIFVSSVTEDGRQWAPEWGSLPVALQRNVTIRGKWKHPNRFIEGLSIQIPYDTLPQLFAFRPDVIVSGEMGTRSAQAALYCKFVPTCRLVVWATVSEVTEQGRGRLRERARRRLLRLADAVIVNGESGARYVIRFGAPQRLVFRAAQTVDVKQFLAVPATRCEPIRRRVLYCGGLIERKGLVPFAQELVTRAERAPNETIEYWLAGGGNLDRRIADLRWPSNVRIRMFGHVPYDRLPEIYAEVGIFAFPTLADEWGLVVVEAMAAGLPVLGSVYSQAVEELVVDGRNGWTFRPDDPASVSSALDRALGAPTEELDQMAGNARGDVSGMTPAAMADSIMAAVDYAVSNRS